MAKKEVKKKSVGSAAKREKLQKEAEGFVVTQEYFDAHPELEAEGVSVGDTIELPEAPKETSKKLDLDGEVAILKGSEYIRTYPEGNEEGVQSFLSKGPYVAVSPDDISSITVAWRESIKSKDADSGRIVDTGRMETKSVTFSEKTHGTGWMQQARSLANQAPKRTCVAKLG